MVQSPGMPRSKRQKVVHTSVTKKKGRELKDKVHVGVRREVDAHARCYVVTWRNQNNVAQKELREVLKAGGHTLCLSKNAVVSVALGGGGKGAGKEYCKGLGAVASQLKGTRGLVFSDAGPEDVVGLLEGYAHASCARQGFRATETVVVPAGPLPQFDFSMEQQLRKLGLPTRLNKSVVEMLADHVVCVKGQPLTADQGRILKLLEHRMAVFRIKCLGVWEKATGKYTVLGDADAFHAEEGGGDRFVDPDDMEEDV